MGRGGGEGDQGSGGTALAEERRDEKEPFDFTVTVKMFPKRGQPEKDDGFTIAKGNQSTTGREVVCKGNFGPVSVGQTIRVLRWSQKNDSRWGPSIRVWAIEHSDPVSREALISYLEHLPGVGPVTAQAIVAQLGTSCLEQIDRDPSLLLSIDLPRRISTDLVELEQSWAGLRAQRKALIYLSELGLGDAQAKRIIEALGDHSEERIKKDPYALTEIQGISFRVADEIAAKIGIGPLDERRLGAGLEYLLAQAENDGHICLERHEVLEAAPELLTRDGKSPGSDDLEEAMKMMVDNGRLWIEEGPDGKERVYTTEHYLIETRLYGLLADRMKGVARDLPARLQEKPADSALTDEQWQAVQQSFSERMSILTGGPGCGKTYTLSTVLKEIEGNGEKAVCLAPTGKAAKRMEETTGREASTIHRALGRSGLVPPTSLEDDGRNVEYLDGDVIVVDEASMLDMRLAERLLTHVRPDSRIILVGDPGQLPAVGAGSVLHDLIESDRVEKTELTKVFRQGQGSLLVINAHRMREGKEPFWSAEEAEQELGHAVREDWKFVESPSADIPARALEEVRQTASDLGVLPEEIMVTAPSKRGSAGVHILNQRLGGERNPDGLKIRGGESPLRVGDRVMNTENRYGQPGRDNSVMNGDQGRVVSWDEKTKTAWADFGLQENIPYAGEELKSLIPAYAATTHKLQGSEYPGVVCSVSSETHPGLLSRNMFYTGMTRAKEMCIMVGDRETLRQALRVDGSKRKTTLDLRISQLAPRLKSRSERLAKGLKIKSPEQLLYG
jgi:exodeoxyribonuclease V alpha subunit